MSSSLKLSYINLSQLDTIQKSRLIQRCQTVHQAVTNGISDQKLESLLFRRGESGAEYAELVVLENQVGEMLAWCSCHAFEVQVLNKPAVVFRGSIFALPGINFNLYIAKYSIKILIRFFLKRPFTTHYFFCEFVDPIPYHLVTAYLHEYYPHPVKQSQWANQLKDDCVNRFDYQLDSEHPWLTEAFATNPNPKRIQAGRHDAIDYYLKINPGYQTGTALLFVTPITLINFLAICKTLISRLFKKAGATFIPKMKKKKTSKG